MTLQLLHSEFPYFWGKFFFYQCSIQVLDSLESALHRLSSLIYIHQMCELQGNKDEGSWCCLAFLEAAILEKISLCCNSVRTEPHSALTPYIKSPSWPKLEFLPLKLKSDSAHWFSVSNVSIDSAYAEPTTKNRKNVPYYQRKNIIKIGTQNIIHFTLAAAAVWWFSFLYF